MTFVQLEYIVALDSCRHFAQAATQCFITQPTLSMQIQKLEEELGVKIFDRSKQPVLPTIAGMEIIEQARKILAERDVLTENIAAKKDIINGELRVGVIPTIAPYLLPLCIPTFAKKYPQVKLIVNEFTTGHIITKLKEGKIDVGLLVTPLQEPGIQEHVLFYEELVAYVSRKNMAYKKTYLLDKDIDPNKLWLLEEGHCFRSQIVNLCELRKSSLEGSHFEYEAGSLETLRRMVDMNDGITILPELATYDMTPRQKMQLRNFKKPIPVREVSVITHRHFVKKRLVEMFKQSIVDSLPQKVKLNKNANLINI
ncbi:hydrogen peroxide-inducible genes activator [Limnovirga soli]|uniref:LysR family transcriptional regulator n=1 Tax=Limnovirga soli TaxID=2656915 RepID=A0A8J8JTE9_9BACT|nr:hydrogen peroxide-inducible genes activator [Limnovirga soli]NNV55848.1 LysR family transcriptional regulator [Limnovirga soli]